jgi:hypothetical protein
VGLQAGGAIKFYFRVACLGPRVSHFGLLGLIRFQTGRHKPSVQVALEPQSCGAQSSYVVILSQILSNLLGAAAV